MQLVYLSVIVHLGMCCSRHQEVALCVDEAYGKFEAAGRVHVKVPFPMNVETCLMWGSYAAHLMRGEVDDPGVSLKIERDKNLLDFPQHHCLLILLLLSVSCWEPRCSQRVSSLNQRLVELNSPSNRHQVKHILYNDVRRIYSLALCCMCCDALVCTCWTMYYGCFCLADDFWCGNKRCNRL